MLVGPMKPLMPNAGAAGAPLAAMIFRAKLIGGGPALPPITATLSKVAALSALVVWLVTASPMFALPIVVLVAPTCVHVEPSADTYPVIVDPARVSFSQMGTACEPPAMKAVDPPVADRVMNSMPPPGFTPRITCAD